MVRYRLEMDEQITSAHRRGHSRINGRFGAVTVALITFELSGCTVGAPSQVPTTDCPSSPGGTVVVDWCARWRSLGYELHITRAESWEDSAEHPISISDWERAARAEAQLVDVETLGWDPIPPAATFVWRDEEGPSLYWADGQVQVKGIRSRDEIGELAAFADKISARLVGDDGELYDTTGAPVPPRASG